MNNVDGGPGSISLPADAILAAQSPLLGLTVSAVKVMSESASGTELLLGGGLVGLAGAIFCDGLMQGPPRLKLMAGREHSDSLPKVTVPCKTRKYVPFLAWGVLMYAAFHPQHDARPGLFQTSAHVLWRSCGSSRYCERKQHNV